MSAQAHLLSSIVSTHRELRRLCLRSARDWHGDSAHQRELVGIFIARARENHELVMNARRRLRELAATSAPQELMA